MKRITLCLLASLLLASFDARSQARDEEPQVIVTGFGPWGWRDSNPSWEGAKLLAGEVIEGHTVVTRELEVDYRKVRAALPKLLEEVKRPAVVIHFGVGGSRYELERKARNKAHWGDDDSGYAPVDGRVTDDGAMIYPSGLPEEKIIAALEGSTPKMTTSTDAGAYLCEFTFYLEMYYQDKRAIGSDAGFIHVPYINDTTVTAASIAEVMRKAVRAALLERKPPEPEQKTPEQKRPPEQPQRKPPPGSTEQKTPVDDPRQGATGSLPDDED